MAGEHFYLNSGPREGLDPALPEEGDSFDGVRAANAAVRYEWSAWHLGFDVRARVSFQETCAWTAVFWGRGLR